MAEETPEAHTELRKKRRSRTPWVVGLVTVLASVATILAVSLDFYDRFTDPPTPAPIPTPHPAKPADSPPIEVVTADSPPIEVVAADSLPIEVVTADSPAIEAPAEPAPARQLTSTVEPPPAEKDPTPETLDPPESAVLTEPTPAAPCVLTPARPTCQLGPEALRVSVRYPRPDRAILSITGPRMEPLLETILAEASGTLPLVDGPSSTASVRVTHRGASQEVEVELLP